MSKKTGFFFGTDKFNKSLIRFAKENEKEAKEGLFKGFNMMLSDAKWKPPQAPWKIGDLHASAEIDKITITRKKIEVSGGFNISYAGVLHEQEKDYKEPTRTRVKQPGPKFLETKMVQYGKDYIEEAVKQMRGLYR